MSAGPESQARPGVEQDSPEQAAASSRARRQAEELQAIIDERDAADLAARPERPSAWGSDQAARRRLGVDVPAVPPGPEPGGKHPHSSEGAPNERLWSEQVAPGSHLPETTPFPLNVPEKAIRHGVDRIGQSQRENEQAREDVNLPREHPRSWAQARREMAVDGQLHMDATGDWQDARRREMGMPPRPDTMREAGRQMRRELGRQIRGPEPEPIMTDEALADQVRAVIWDYEHPGERPIANGQDRQRVANPVAQEVLRVIQQVWPEERTRMHARNAGSEAGNGHGGHGNGHGGEHSNGHGGHAEGAHDHAEPATIGRNTLTYQQMLAAHEVLTDMLAMPEKPNLVLKTKYDEPRETEDTARKWSQHIPVLALPFKEAIWESIEANSKLMGADGPIEKRIYVSKVSAEDGNPIVMVEYVQPEKKRLIRHNVPEKRLKVDIFRSPTEEPIKRSLFGLGSKRLDKKVGERFVYHHRPPSVQYKPDGYVQREEDYEFHAAASERQMGDALERYVSDEERQRPREERGYPQGPAPRYRLDPRAYKPGFGPNAQHPPEAAPSAEERASMGDMSVARPLAETITHAGEGSYAHTAESVRRARENARAAGLMPETVAPGKATTTVERTTPPGPTVPAALSAPEAAARPEAAVIGPQPPDGGPGGPGEGPEAAGGARLPEPTPPDRGGGGEVAPGLERHGTPEDMDHLRDATDDLQTILQMTDATERGVQLDALQRKARGSGVLLLPRLDDQGRPVGPEGARAGFQQATEFANELERLKAETRQALYQRARDAAERLAKREEARAAQRPPGSASGGVSGAGGGVGGAEIPRTQPEMAPRSVEVLNRPLNESEGVWMRRMDRMAQLAREHSTPEQRQKAADDITALAEGRGFGATDAESGQRRMAPGTEQLWANVDNLRTQSQPEVAPGSPSSFALERRPTASRFEQSPREPVVGSESEQPERREMTYKELQSLTHSIVRKIEAYASSNQNLAPDQLRAKLVEEMTPAMDAGLVKINRRKGQLPFEPGIDPATGESHPLGVRLLKTLLQPERAKLLKIQGAVRAAERLEKGDKPKKKKKK